MCISHFSHFSLFLTIFHVLPCVCLIFHVFQFSRLNLGPSVHFSSFTLISVSRHIPGARVCISHFSTFFSFLAIFQVLQCVYLIFHDFQCFLPYSRSYQLIFSISELVSFLDIFQVLQCTFLIFHIFHCFLPYYRSYSVCVSFSTFFSFLAIIQVLLFESVIFLVGQFSHHITTVCIYHF